MLCYTASQPNPMITHLMPQSEDSDSEEESGMAEETNHLYRVVGKGQHKPCRDLQLLEVLGSSVMPLIPLLYQEAWTMVILVLLLTEAADQKQVVSDFVQSPALANLVSFLLKV